MLVYLKKKVISRYNQGIKDVRTEYDQIDANNAKA